MTDARARLRGEDDGGFTLLELMVVLLIIALLIAIAVPTFLGTKARAQDRAAQTDLRNTMANARTFSVEHQGYYNNDAGAIISATDMQDVEGALVFVGPGNAAKGRIGVLVDGDPAAYDDGNAEPGEWAIFITKSGSGRYYCIYNDTQTMVLYGKGSSEADLDTPAECQDETW